MALEFGFTGDVMLGRLVDRRQRHRPPEAVWGNMLSRMQGLDGLVINLECCLSTRGRRWQRTHRPFHFRADPNWAIPALRRTGVDCCALANNHVLDYEEVALSDTLEALDDAKIAGTGAGMNRDLALDPAVFSMGDLRVAVISFTDNLPEYAATETTPGTAHIDVDVDDPETRSMIRTALSRAADADPALVVASLHWGPNMVERPSPAFQRFGRWLLDQEVDVVHGHSAHVFHGIEVVDGGVIIYDAGDYVDDYAVDDELRNDRSFLFVLECTGDGRPAHLRLEPIEIYDAAVHKAGPGPASWSRERMRRRTREFDTTFDRDGEALIIDLS